MLSFSLQQMNQSTFSQEQPLHKNPLQDHIFSQTSPDMGGLLTGLEGKLCTAAATAAWWW